MYENTIKSMVDMVNSNVAINKAEALAIVNAGVKALAKQPRKTKTIDAEALIIKDKSFYTLVQASQGRIYGLVNNCYISCPTPLPEGVYDFEKCKKLAKTRLESDFLERVKAEVTYNNVNEYDNTISIKVNLKALKQQLTAIDTCEKREYLRGLWFYPQENMTIATNGHMILSQELSHQFGGKNPFIVSKDFLDLMLTYNITEFNVMFKDADCVAYEFRQNDVTVYRQCISECCPEFRQVIPYSSYFAAPRKTEILELDLRQIPAEAFKTASKPLAAWDKGGTLIKLEYNDTLALDSTLATYAAFNPYYIRKITENDVFKATRELDGDGRMMCSNPVWGDADNGLKFVLMPVTF